MTTVAVTVNGRLRRETVEPRLLLSDFLRHTLGLTGTHVGCEHGVCGAARSAWTASLFAPACCWRSRSTGRRSRPSRAWPAATD